MNDPLQRKMSRQAGMSKQPMGILASSPELMGAVKGYKLGGVPEIPMYNTPKFQLFKSPGEDLGLGEIGTSKIGDKLKEEKDKKELENKMKQILEDYEPILNAKQIEGEVITSESSSPIDEESLSDPQN